MEEKENKGKATVETALWMANRDRRNIPERGRGKGKLPTLRSLDSP